MGARQVSDSRQKGVSVGWVLDGYHVSDESQDGCQMGPQSSVPWGWPALACIAQASCHPHCPPLPAHLRPPARVSVTGTIEVTVTGRAVAVRENTRLRLMFRLRLVTLFRFSISLSLSLSLSLTLTLTHPCPFPYSLTPTLTLALALR